MSESLRPLNSYLNGFRVIIEYRLFVRCFIVERAIASKSLRKSFFFGILFIGILGVPVHYLYELSGNSPIVAFFAPVNESVWEHLKLSLLPTVIWWTLTYIILKRKSQIIFSSWFFSFVTAFLACTLIIVSFYYSYTGAFGIHSTALDIFSYYLGVSLSQLIAMHIYIHARINSFLFYLSALIFAILMIAFIIFTFDPPQLPIFEEL
jgi:hypothetical protein